MWMLLLKNAAQFVLNFSEYRKAIAPLYYAFQKKNKSYLSKEKSRRIFQYCMITPILLGYGFSLLRQKKITAPERFTLMRLSAATPFFDDFFDHEKEGEEKLRKIFDEKENYKSASPFEEFFCSLLFSPPKIKMLGELIPLAWDVFVQQQQSAEALQQATISRQQLHTASLTKGGASAVLFSKILFPADSEKIKPIAQQAGRVIQFTDDIFDIWFDLQSHTPTLATTCNDVAVLEQEYLAEIDLLKNLVEESAFKAEAKKAFLRQQHIFHALGWVALARLKKLQGAQPAWEPAQYTRRQLVCDMEHWQNRLTWLRRL